MRDMHPTREMMFCVLNPCLFRRVHPKKRLKFRLSKSEFLLLLALLFQEPKSEELVLFVLSLAVPDSHPLPSIAEMNFLLEYLLQVDVVKIIHAELGLDRW